MEAKGKKDRNKRREKGRRGVIGCEEAWGRLRETDTWIEKEHNLHFFLATNMN
ncbi:hypothetical protein FACS189472_17890 [Alphaproteobacteria bacterium]|nr:hypothetical protein FACS189472_17890 [Alphaproteobacteria bacterium]